MATSKYVSILIPIYNGIEFLDECINSIKKQTYKKWEVILGINGHSSNSEVYQIALKYKTDKIHVIEYNTIGKGQTLNHMVLDSKYDIICLLDVDDKWNPNKLQLQILKKQNYDIVGTWCQYFGDNNIIIRVPSGKVHPLQFLKENPIINSSCMLNKTDCNWRENYILEDYDLWLKLNYEGKSVYNIPNVLTYHRIHRNSFFNNQNDNYVSDLVKQWGKKYFEKETFRNLLKTY